MSEKISVSDADALALEDDLLDVLAEEEDLPLPPSSEPLHGEAESSASAETSSHLLATYFHEMSRLSMLSAEEEMAIAQRIGALELELWVKLLSLPALCPHLLQVVERNLDERPPEFSALRRTLSLGRPAMMQAVVTLAERLCALDTDRLYVALVLAEIKKISPGHVGPPPVPLAVGSVRHYLKEVHGTVRRLQRAKHEFVKANLRLVVFIARRFNNGRLPLADLIQEGNIGLIKAVDRFDPRRGTRFSTYAAWWIRHAIARAVADKGRAVRLPVHILAVQQRLARSRRELQNKLGRPPTSEELGQDTGLAVAKIERIRSYVLDQPCSLDQALSDEDGRKFVDFLQDESLGSQPLEQLAHATLTTEVRHLLYNVKPIEADILRQRFGLDSEDELTLHEIGERYNLSRERIRQLEKQALQKLRQAMQKRGMM